MNRQQNTRRISISIPGDAVIEFTLAFFMYYGVMTSGLEWLFEGIHFPIFNLTPLFWGILVVLLASCLYKISLHNIKCDVLFFALIFFLMFLRPAFNSDYWRAIQANGVMRHVFLEGMLTYFLVRHVANYQKLIEWMTVFAVAVFVLYSLDFFLVDVGNRNNYKAYGGGLVQCFLVFAINWLLLGNKKFVVPFFISSILAITCGRRTSIISLFVTIVLVLIIKRKYLRLVIIAFAGVCLFAFYDRIVYFLIDIIRLFGVRPRNLLRLQAGTIGEISDRWNIWSYCLNIISSSNANFLFGAGIGADRYFLSEGLWLGEANGYPYPHNIIVEMIFHYGYFFGAILSILFIALIPIYIYKKTIKREDVFALGFCMYIILNIPGFVGHRVRTS